MSKVHVPIWRLRVTQESAKIQKVPSVTLRHRLSSLYHSIQEHPSALPSPLTTASTLPLTSTHSRFICVPISWFSILYYLKVFAREISEASIWAFIWELITSCHDCSRRRVK